MICNFAQTNKSILNICSNRYFWFEKFKKYHLEMIYDKYKTCYDWALEYDSVQKASEELNIFNQHLNIDLNQCEISFNKIYEHYIDFTFIPTSLVYHMIKYNITLDSNFRFIFYIKKRQYSVLYLGVSPDYNDARMGLDAVSTKAEIKKIYYYFMYHHYHKNIKLNYIQFKEKTRKYKKVY